MMYSKYPIKTVNKIVDGDTIHVSASLGFGITYDVKIRINDIDTPEIRTKDSNEKQKGILCKLYAHELIYSVSCNELFLITSQTPNETFGRIVGDIRLGSVRLFSAEMKKFIITMNEIYSSSRSDDSLYKECIAVLNQSNDNYTDNITGISPPITSDTDIIYIP